ncbi:MAG: hypothetical protein Q9164_000797 [Protoblastenia rupestris]
MFLSLVPNELVYVQNQGTQKDPNVTDFNLYSPDTTINTTITEYSIVQSLKSLIDDSLLAFAITQLVRQYDNSTTQVSGMLTVGAVKVGTCGYVYSLLALNIFLILLYLEEMLRTKYWFDLLIFDYNDLTGAVVASSMGGSDLADTVVAAHAEEGTFWVADPRDLTASKVKIQLKRRDDGSVELVRAEGQGYTPVRGGSDAKPFIGPSSKT